MKFSNKQKEEFANLPEEVLGNKHPELNRGEIRFLKKKFKGELIMEGNDEKNLKKANKELEHKLLDASKELEVAKRLSSDKQEFKIGLYTKSRGIEAVPIILLSDWHIDEIVQAESVNHLNEFNLDIANKRIVRLFNNIVRLLQKVGKDKEGNRAIVCMLGDVISGNIHEELLENTSLRPMDAIIWVQRRIVSGINFLLEHTKLNYTFVCKPGN